MATKTRASKNDHITTLELKRFVNEKKWGQSKTLPNINLFTYLELVFSLTARCIRSRTDMYSCSCLTPVNIIKQSINLQCRRKILLQISQLVRGRQSNPLNITLYKIPQFPTTTRRYHYDLIVKVAILQTHSLHGFPQGDRDVGR